MTSPFRQALLAASFLAIASGCHKSSDSSTGQGGPGTGTPQNTILDQLDGLGLTTLKAAVEAAGLESTLSGPGPLTLVAPTNEAFDQLPAGALDALLDPANQAQLQSVLGYHLLDGDNDSQTLAGLSAVMTVQGDDLLLDSLGGVLAVNDARISSPDNLASNGRIHIADAVLTPPASVIETLQARGYTTLVGAVQSAGLEGALNGGGFTVLAPTNEAFDGLPPGLLDSLTLPGNEAALQSFLQFHLIPGSNRASDLIAAGNIASLDGPQLFVATTPDGVTINNSPLGRVNLPATDGLIHSLDAALMAPDSLTKLVNGDGFAIMAQALTLTGIENTLIEDGPFTLFAPDDNAFLALPPGQLDFLLDPANLDQLTDLVNYHIVPSAQQSFQLQTASSVDTLLGTDISLSIEDDVLTLNGESQVFDADRYASNGVMHAVTRVLSIPGL